MRGPTTGNGSQRVISNINIRNSLEYFGAWWIVGKFEVCLKYMSCCYHLFHFSKFRTASSCKVSEFWDLRLSPTCFASSPTPKHGKLLQIVRCPALSANRKQIKLSIRPCVIASSTLPPQPPIYPSHPPIAKSFSCFFSKLRYFSSFLASSSKRFWYRLSILVLSSLRVLFYLSFSLITFR